MSLCGGHVPRKEQLLVLVCEALVNVDAVFRLPWIFPEAVWTWSSREWRRPGARLSVAEPVPLRWGVVIFRSAATEIEPVRGSPAAGRAGGWRGFTALTFCFGFQNCFSM